MEIKVKKDSTISAAFGGGSFYKVSPAHPYLFPATTITDFLNTHPTQTNKIIEFYGKYMPFTLQITSADFKQTIKDSFQKVKYELDGIFRKVIQEQKLTYKELEVINKYLASVHPKVYSYNQKFSQWISKHIVYTLQAIDSKEQPEIVSVPHGHPESAANEATVEITITPSINSKARWLVAEMTEIKKQQLTEKFNDINIDEFEYKLHKVEFDKENRNITKLSLILQHKEPENFKLKELSALMDINSFESFLAFQLWRMINDPTFRKTYKVCAGGCGRIHTNKGLYCDSQSCAQKYQAMKRRQKYNTDPAEREKRKQAAIRTHNKQRN